MARFFKHVGEANGKRVVIVQRRIPGEDHMCSVVFSQIIPSQYHDDIMRLLESNEGQAANEFYEILQRRQAHNGTNLLQSIAMEGYLKKVPTNQVIVKPNAKSSMRLDELNNLLNQVGQGDQAKQLLAEMESQQGLRDPIKQAQATQPPQRLEEVADTAPTQAGPTDVLDDGAIARMNMQQATQMEADAKNLLAEAERLKEEAYGMDPSLKPKKGPGRPKKSSVTA